MSALLYTRVIICSKPVPVAERYINPATVRYLHHRVINKSVTAKPTYFATVRYGDVKLTRYWNGIIIAAVSVCQQALSTAMTCLYIISYRLRSIMTAGLITITL